MESSRTEVFVDKNVAPAEVANLLDSVGWGEENANGKDAIERSLAAYPFIAYARDEDGQLVGYLSAFCDGAFSTFLGELIVRPGYQRAGLGARLLREVEKRYPNIPIYALPFSDTEPFLAKQGYRAGQRPQRVMFKIPA